MSNKRTGIVRKNKKGFGFVAPDGEGGSLGDIFVAEDNMKGAMNGDTVSVDLLPERYWEHSREGIVDRIIKRAADEVIGTFTSSGKFGFVVSDDRHQADDIYIGSRNFGGARTGDKVAAAIISYPDGKRGAEGKVTEIIARSGETGGDIKALIRQYRITERFPDEVAAEAAAAEKRGIVSEDIAGRRDLRESVRAFTIDGADSKDFDDAVSITVLDNRNYLLGVHIADVSHYVKKSTALDDEAAERGNSIYLVDRVIPMLPEALSNDICSLNPGEDRLTLSVDMEVDAGGNVVRHEIYESVIRSCERLVYADVSDILEKGDEKLTEKYDHIYEDILNMGELAQILEKKKKERGSLDFELNEASIKLDAEGRATDIMPAERRTANRMIEQFMLLANETVAEEYCERKLPFVYRVHEQPEKDRMDEFRIFLRGIGISIQGGSENVTPLQLSGVLKRAEGHQYENVVNSVMLKSMQKAVYDTECKGHFGLALKYYCHFTSPIRRYPDLMIHRIIKANIHNELPAEKELIADVRRAAEHSSETEKKAVDLERDVEKIKMCEYMEGHVGERYNGVISGVTGFGLFVELPNTVEGLVHIAGLDDDYYEYEPRKYRLIGKNRKRSYSLGDPIRIEVVSADSGTGEIDFKIIK